VHYKDVIHVLSGITYKPGWRLKVGMREDSHMMQVPMIRVHIEFDAQCARTGNHETQVCSTHTIDPDTVPNGPALLRRVLQFFLQAEHHECCEFFKYRGTTPFDPHKELAL
jgi:hypothetical protein